LLVPHGNSESKVVLRWKTVGIEISTSVSEFPCWCLMGIQESKESVLKK
jgi:hypothetical protein